MSLEEHTENVNSIVITSYNNYIASGSPDTSVKLWNFQNSNVHTTLQAILPE